MNESMIIRDLMGSSINSAITSDLQFIIEIILMISSFVYFWYCIFKTTSFKELYSMGFDSDDKQYYLSGEIKASARCLKRQPNSNKSLSLNKFSRRRLYLGLVQKQKESLENFHSKNKSLKVGSIM